MDQIRQGKELKAVSMSAGVDKYVPDQYMKVSLNQHGRDSVGSVMLSLEHKHIATSQLLCESETKSVADTTENVCAQQNLCTLSEDRSCNKDRTSLSLSLCSFNIMSLFPLVPYSIDCELDIESLDQLQLQQSCGPSEDSGDSFSESSLNASGVEIEHSYLNAHDLNDYSLNLSIPQTGIDIEDNSAYAQSLEPSERIDPAQSVVYTWSAEKKTSVFLKVLKFFVYLSMQVGVIWLFHWNLSFLFPYPASVIVLIMSLGVLCALLLSLTLVPNCCYF